MGIMTRQFNVYDRAPYAPRVCAVTGTSGSAENPLIDLELQIDHYGMVYLSYSVLTAIAVQLGFAAPIEAKMLREENAKLKEMVTRVPGVIERLSNDIRDISISATADLLSDNAPVVLDNDKELEQSDTRANLDYFGDDNTSKPDSKPAVGKGPTSVSANSSSKRQPVTVPKPSSSSN
jgi:hypothetical protein